MPTALEKAQARLKDLAANLQTLQEKDTLTADDLTAINKTVDDIEACEAEIKALERAEQARARQAVPAGTEVIPASDRQVARGHNGAPAKIKARTKSLDVHQKVSLLSAGFLLAKCHEMPRGAALELIKDAGYEDFAVELEYEYSLKRAVTVGNPSGVGTAASISSIIPDSLGGPFVDILRPEVTFLQGGPRRVEFAHGQFNQPKGVGSSIAGYVGEGQKKPVGQPTFGAQGMTPKKLAGIVLVTEEARDWSLIGLENYIREDLKSTMSTTWDFQSYWGAGSATAPTGIFNVAGINEVSHTFADPYAPTLAELDAVATKMELAISLKNIKPTSAWAWVMDWRTFKYLADMRVGADKDGQPAFPELQGENPRWKGRRVLVSTSHPANGGPDTNEATLGLVDFNNVLYGEDLGLTIKAATEASVDVNGTIVHLWQQNMIGVLMELRHNWMLQRPEAVSILEGVTWGSFDPTP